MTLDTVRAARTDAGRALLTHSRTDSHATLQTRARVHCRNQDHCESYRIIIASRGGQHCPIAAPGETSNPLDAVRTTYTHTPVAHPHTQNTTSSAHIDTHRILSAVAGQWCWKRVDQSVAALAAFSARSQHRSRPSRVSRENCSENKPGVEKSMKSSRWLLTRVMVAPHPRCGLDRELSELESGRR